MKRRGYQWPLRSSGLVLTTSALGDDFSQGKGAKATANWKVLNLDSGHWTHKPAEAFADGIGFAFGTTPSTRFFLTDHQGSGLLGRPDRQDADGDVHDHRHGHRVHLRPRKIRPRRRLGRGEERRLPHARIGAALLSRTAPTAPSRRAPPAGQGNGGRPRRRTP